MEEDDIKKLIFGGRLKNLRQEKRVKVKECILKIGCSARTWHRWENGVSSPISVYKPKLLEVFPELGDF